MAPAATWVLLGLQMECTSRNEAVFAVMICAIMLLPGCQKAWSQ